MTYDEVMNALTDAEIDAGGEALRRYQMSGRRTVEWAKLPGSMKKRWLHAAATVLAAARTSASTPEVPAECAIAMCDFIERQAGEIARLKVEVAECKRAAVKAVVPLEAMRMAGTDKDFCPQLRDGVSDGIASVRALVTPRRTRHAGQHDRRHPRRRPARQPRACQNGDVTMPTIEEIPAEIERKWEKRRIASGEIPDPLAAYKQAIRECFAPLRGKYRLVRIEEPASPAPATEGGHG